MPDIDIFDPVAFFDRRITELEEDLSGKRTMLEILRVNRQRLTDTLMHLGELAEEDQKALQVEVASLSEALSATQRAVDGLVAEIQMLTAKINALKSGRQRVMAQPSQSSGRS